MGTVAGHSLSPDRLSVAYRALGELSEDQLERVVWSRLLGRSERMLPPLGRDENPSDLFIGVIEEYPQSEVAERLQRLAARLLDQVARASSQSPDVVGELCYLASASESRTAVHGLMKLIVSDRAASDVLSNGQTLRVFAFRCLLGLLHSVADELRTEDFRIWLEPLLHDHTTRTFALTALTGLWPERWKDYRRQVPRADVKRLKASLEVAGFDATLID